MFQVLWFGLPPWYWLPHWTILILTASLNHLDIDGPTEPPWYWRPHWTTLILTASLNPNWTALLLPGSLNHLDIDDYTEPLWYWRPHWTTLILTAPLKELLRSFSQEASVLKSARNDQIKTGMKSISKFTSSVAARASIFQPLANHFFSYPSFFNMILLRQDFFGWLILYLGSKLLLSWTDKIKPAKHSDKEKYENFAKQTSKTSIILFLQKLRTYIVKIDLLNGVEMNFNLSFGYILESCK